MEKLQIAAARIVTGTNSYASKQLLYSDIGWEKLSNRREKHRLILFYKIINGLSPPHLNKIFENYLIRNERYQFRTDNIRYAYTRTETFRCSFFPNSIRLWNSLDPSIRSADTLCQFKEKLLNKKLKNLYYTYGDRPINYITASMRMNCSQLNGDLFKNNITGNKFCTCGLEETAFHYFFECRNYTLHRNTLLHDTVFVTILSVQIILNGDNTISDHENMQLHRAVSKFITSSERFKI